ncbi:MAG: hypothetical protein DRH57_09345 [Candidatus Cloacimonadota bacterium]|nr:MAG: hypothetical protein DRH57_09345 [Candidatus Cloacimonadota bacterium]
MNNDISVCNGLILTQNKDSLLNPKILPNDYYFSTQYYSEYGETIPLHIIDFDIISIIFNYISIHHIEYIALFPDRDITNIFYTVEQYPF